MDILLNKINIMKSITEFLLEAGEEAAVAAPQEPAKEDKEPNTSLLKQDIKPEKKCGAMIYDKILNSIQVVQFDNSGDLEGFFDLNSGTMKYIDNMNPGDTNEDDNSILTIIWKKTE